MPTDSNLAAATLTHEANARASEDNASIKKRGAFLTRRFFGGQDKKSPLPVEAVAAVGADLQGPGPEMADGAVMDSAQQPESVPISTPGKLAYGAAPDSPAADADADAEPPAPPAPAAADAPATPLPAPAALPAAEPRAAAPFSREPTPTMIPTEPDPGTSTTGRASAQLTLAFEVTSLQLTPFFRIGSVQLKALSNVVSLGLIATQQAEGPLAAGISFQIDRVELDGKSRLQSILLKPLGESREVAEPLPTLRVDGVALGGEAEDAPISVTTSGAASTVVQLVGTFAIGAMEFTPSFEIDSLRLEPVSNTVRLRVAPASQPGTNGLPPAFEIAEVQLGEGGQISGLRAVPGTHETA